jgi:DNA-directed RNA polymerase subunit L
MEIELLEKDKDSIMIRIKDADMTLISPLVKELLDDKDVIQVKYTSGSTNLNHPTLHLKVKTGKPQTGQGEAREGT